MGEMIYWELDYVLSCVLWGLFLMLIYDLLRIERRVWRRGSIWVSIEDILYWSFAAIGTFRLFYQQDNGVIRWFAIAVTFFVMLLMNRFISKWTVPFISRILRIPVRFFEKMVKKVIGFFQKILKNCVKQLKLEQKKATIKKQERQEEKQKKQREQEEQQRQKRQKKEEEREKKGKLKEQEKKKRKKKERQKHREKRTETAKEVEQVGRANKIERKKIKVKAEETKKRTEIRKKGQKKE